MGRYDDTEVEDTPTTAAPAPVTEDRDRVSPETLASAGRVIKRGWSAADSTRSADSPYAQSLKLAEKPQLIKFDEDDPYASFHSHWIEGRSGQKSFVCLAQIDPAGCPLCDAGNRPSAKFSFNVLLLTPEGEAVRRSFDVGARVLDQLKNFHNDPRQGPLSKHYWAVSRTGTKSSSNTSIQLVKERDLDEDWPGHASLSAEELSAHKATAYTNSIVSISSRKTLQSVAAEDLGAD